MDKIQKALQKLSGTERNAVKKVLVAINTQKLTGLDIQKLKGHKNIFRVRKRGIRILFRQTESEIFILAIERRSEKTYRKF